MQKKNKTTAHSGLVLIIINIDKSFYSAFVFLLLYRIVNVKTSMIIVKWNLTENPLKCINLAIVKRCCSIEAKQLVAIVVVEYLVTAINT